MQEPAIEGFRRRERSLVSLGLTCARSDSLAEVLDAAVQEVRAALDVRFAKILELRPDGSMLVRAGDGWGPGVVGEVEIGANEESAASYALHTRRPVVVTDLLRERRFTAAPVFVELGVRSGVNVIIEPSGLPYGVLEADADRPRDYSDDEILFLQAAANLIAVAIERQQFEEERNHLVNVASHELRNPLAIVLAFAERLVRADRNGSALSEEARRAADEEVLTGALRLQRLLDVLLQLGRVERGPTIRLGEVDLVESVRSIVRDVGVLYPTIRFEEELPERLLLSTDAELGRMVIGNIVENAAKYSRLAPQVRVAVDQAGGRARVRVLDSCGGIAGNELDFLFDRYFRGNAAEEARGLGLGLFVAHRVAEVMGWTIDVRNLPGEGCEFTIGIPLEPKL